MASDGDPVNLSGAWQGQFTYPNKRPGVAFSAELSDREGALSGTTEEIGHYGDAAGCRLVAALDGRRRGHTVTWLKIYDGRSRYYDAVRYEGTVSADGLEIEGRWTVPGNWSGTFLMIRPAAAPESVETSVSETV